MNISLRCDGVQVAALVKYKVKDHGQSTGFVCLFVLWKRVTVYAEPKQHRLKKDQNISRLEKNKMEKYINFNFSIIIEKGFNHILHPIK